MRANWQGAPIVKPPLVGTRRLRRLPVLIWVVGVVGIVVLSLVPKAAPSPRIDEYVHLAAFAFLAALSLLAFRRPRSAALSIVSVVVVGLIIEAAQSLVPGRSASLEDVAANLAGVAVGVIVGLPIVVFVRRRRRVDQKPK